ncbi:MAG: type ISP restriction/modification enzyme, partial [Lentisphaerota bacterium]
LEFRLFRNGQKVSIVHLGILEDGKIRPDKNQWAVFESFIKDFCSYQTQTITSAEKLAKLMAAKAQLLQEAIYKSLTLDKGGNTSDDKSRPAVYEPQAEYGNSNSLQNQLQAFKKILIHDMDESIFADIYSQTVVYGMFAARLADPTLETFTRGEAMFLIPKSNPFLRQLFTYVAGPELDDRITWIVDSLADVFRACDIRKILQDFKKTSGHDPMIHFYETFLGEYNPKLRKARGVYYTPEPVVKFIVRSVDEILKTEFGLPQGLADTSKVELEVENPQGKRKLRQLVHKVQLLDPAAGIGTFLCEVIRQIYAKFANQQGLWNSYVEEHLIPRVHGFELLMAPYAMCHLKLEMLLAETGYKSEKDQRLSVYLTNSLEEPHPDTQTLFASWLSHEAEEANRVKRDCPVMVVIGNPPYAVSSSNKGEWIQKLLADYKKDLNERNIQPLSDDYIKFIRYAEHFIEKNGQGIVAMITNNSFIDGLIHRQMRKHLLETFDNIYILDLHGNSKKKETALDGGKDENVFDIMQGVSISIFVKNGEKKSGKLASVFQVDSYGEREVKYNLLNTQSLSSINWAKINIKEPDYFFKFQDFTVLKSYEQWFSLKLMFPLNSSGIKTHRDDFIIDFDKSDLKNRIIDFFNPTISDEQLRTKYKLKDNRDWSLAESRLKTTYEQNKFQVIDYRPFDLRSIYYDSKLIDFGRENVMGHILEGNNFSLIVCRQQSSSDYQHSFISKKISDINSISLQTKEISYIFPL